MYGISSFQTALVLSPGETKSNLSNPFVFFPDIRLWENVWEATQTLDCCWTPQKNYKICQRKSNVCARNIYRKISYKIPVTDNALVLLFTPFMSWRVLIQSSCPWPSLLADLCPGLLFGTADCCLIFLLRIDHIILSQTPKRWRTFQINLRNTLNTIRFSSSCSKNWHLNFHTS